METLSEKLRQSKDGWSEQGARLFHDTREVGKTFMTFVQGEAKGWTEYLKLRSLELVGRDQGEPRPIEEETDEPEAEASEGQQGAAPQDEPEEVIEVISREEEETEEVSA